MFPAKRSSTPERTVPYLHFAVNLLSCLPGSIPQNRTPYAAGKGTKTPESCTGRSYILLLQIGFSGHPPHFRRIPFHPQNTRSYSIRATKPIIIKIVPYSQAA